MLQRARLTGMPLAVKSTIVTSVTIAVLMTVFGFVTYTTSKQALNREIDVFGASLARALAIPDADWWDPAHGSLQAAARRVTEDAKEFDEYLSAQYGITVTRPAASPRSEASADEERPGQGSDALRDQRKRARDALQEIATRNKERLGRLLRYTSGDRSAASAIIDAFIKVEGSSEGVVRANLASPAFRASSAPRAFTVSTDGTDVPTDVRIIEGRFDDAGAARSYSYPIRDTAGRITHRAFVFLSESSIQGRLTDLLMKILLCTLAFIAIGAGVTFALTRQMIAPLSGLVRDIEIVSSGNLKHRTVSHSSDEIGLLARTFDNMVRSLEKAESERTEHRALRHEVAVASEVQSKLIPDSLPVIPGFELEVVRLTTGDVSGSYYDLLDFPDGKIGVVVAEGSGQGVPAAMTVVMARSLLRSEAERSSDPKEILERTNAALSRDIRKGMYVSILLAVLDPVQRKMMICGAGRVSFQLHRAATRELETIVPDGIALGFDRGPVFDRSLRITELELDLADRLVLHTGAPSRLKNPSGDALGEELWQAIVKKTSDKNTRAFVTILEGTLEKFRDEAPLEEDVIVMTLKVGREKSIE